MATSKKKVPAGTVEAFRKLHDRAYIARARIVTALRTLGNAYEYEGDFVARTGLDRTSFARAKEEFAAAHSFMPPRIRGATNPKRVWCGTSAFCKKLIASLEPK